MTNDTDDPDIDTARRRFLDQAARLAIITPPAIFSLTMATPRAHASGFSFPPGPPPETPVGPPPGRPPVRP